MSDFLPQELIRQKRDGKPLPPAAIESFVAGIADGSISEGQAAAFAMAVFFQGLEAEETVALTSAMAHSGRMLTWPAIDRPILDKHSTGGVGDKVSLILGPILAACGAAVPMISGRGLGHTGGTLDKLDSIPGYNTAPDIETFQKAVKEAHCAIIGQTSDLAPADRRLYGIRDVTATVESIPLITASILSKKLAAGLDGLVMDVKTGNGAFMANTEDACQLANSIASVARGAGLSTNALVTASRPPGSAPSGAPDSPHPGRSDSRGERRRPARQPRDSTRSPADRSRAARPWSLRDHHEPGRSERSLPESEDRRPSRIATGRCGSRPPPIGRGLPTPARSRDGRSVHRAPSGRRARTHRAPAAAGQP